MADSKAPTTETKTQAKKKAPMKKYMSTKYTMWHPFAKVHVSMGPPGVSLPSDDSWVISQVERGLIKEM